MVGLPGQTLRDLAGDIRFFKDLNAHMIGMGPYITEPDTPVAGGSVLGPCNNDSSAGCCQQCSLSYVGKCAAS
jgi:hypothetical protein